MFLLYKELVFLQGVFSRNDIRVIPLKGPLLSLKLYNDVTFRTSKDLDFLVNKKDYGLIEEQLCSFGYSGPTKVDFSVQNEVKFLKDDIQVEIHVYLFSPKHIEASYTMDFLKRFEVDNKRLSMTNAGEFLYLCLHGAKHRWSRKKWLEDIKTYLEVFPKVLSELRSKDLKRFELIAIREALFMVKKVFNVDYIFDKDLSKPYSIVVWRNYNVFRNQIALDNKVHKTGLVFHMFSIVYQLYNFGMWGMFRYISKKWL